MILNIKNTCGQDYNAYVYFLIKINYSTSRITLLSTFNTLDISQ